MDNINHQNYQSPTKNHSPSSYVHPHQVQHTRTCYCPIAMTLKLKLINISSENQVLKKKLTQMEQQLQKTKQNYHCYSSASKTHKITLCQSKQTTPTENLSLITQTLCGQKSGVNQIILKQNHFLFGQSTQQKEQCHRLQSYEQFRKLASQEKQTVKSLQFSFDSKSYWESRGKLHDQQQFFSLREEYEQMLQNLQANSQNKIKQLEEQINILTQSNLRLQQIAKNNILESEEYEIRKTSYFKPIQQQENEQSISQRQPEQAQVSQIMYLTNFDGSHSLSNQNLGEIAEQMRNLKSALQNSYQFLRKITVGLKSLTKLCKLMLQVQNKVKLLPISEYLSLSDCKKKKAVANRKSELLAQQNKQLRQIISQLTSSNKHH